MCDAPALNQDYGHAIGWLAMHGAARPRQAWAFGCAAISRFQEPSFVDGSV